MLVVHVYVLTHAVLYRSLSLCLFISSVCSCLWVHASEVEREEEEWGAVFALRGAHVVLPDQKEDMQWGRLHVVVLCMCCALLLLFYVSLLGGGGAGIASAGLCTCVCAASKCLFFSLVCLVSCAM